VETLCEAQQVRDLIGRCLAGDRDAAVGFQQTYGELIYGFPMRAYRVPPEDAGDFYVFAFEDGRIFRRSRTYEGRAPFRAYLVGSVLDHLVLEWKRSKKEIETVSLDDVPEPSDPGGADPDLGGTFVEVSGQLRVSTASETDTGDGESAMDRELLKGLLCSIEPSRAVILKLLYVEDYDFEPDEIRHLAQTSGRSVAEVVVGVDRLRAMVREREATAKGIEDELDAVHAWVELYERRLRRITEDLTALPPGSTTAVRLREERADVERKIPRRRAQRTKLVARRQRRKLTAPYKEIAALLNTTVGNVGSLITRLRQELMAQREEMHGSGTGGRRTGEQHD
jgi:RNA polymerase sigma factor (sigma-70 family)